MSAEEPATWESYEEVARYLLEKMGDALGLGLERVEGKQKLVGPSPGELQHGQITPTRGGLVDKNTKGKRARVVPLIDPIRDIVERRIELAGHDPEARLLTGPKGGRITTATLCDAT